MCKHILNAQVSIRASCCKKWYDCPECHSEVQDHPLMKTNEMVFACKKCKKVFRKDLEEFDESDEYCPNCDNHFVIEAKTPDQNKKLMLKIEGTEQGFIRDEREKPRHVEENQEILKGWN